MADVPRIISWSVSAASFPPRPLRPSRAQLVADAGSVRRGDRRDITPDIRKRRRDYFLPR